MLAPEVPVDVQIALAEEIHADFSTLTTDGEGRGPDTQSMVTSLTDKFADGVKFDTPGVVTSALRRCLKLKAPEAYAKIMNRLMTTGQQATPDILD